MSFLVDENGKKRFDLRVTITDPKSGQVIKQQPYQKFVQRGADPEEWYVRDGKRYAMNGEPLDKPKKVAPAPKAPEKTEPADPEKDIL